MAYLLDTHTFLWFVAGDKKLPSSVKAIIKDITQPWLTIDISLEELFRFAERNQIEVIPISKRHLIALLDLELLHNDPFDRIIIFQNITEETVLITRDKAIRKYKIKQRWA